MKDPRFGGLHLRIKHYKLWTATQRRVGVGAAPICCGESDTWSVWGPNARAQVSYLMGRWRPSIDFAASSPGIDFAAVTWGYANRQALLTASPALVFDAVADVAELLTGHE